MSTLEFPASVSAKVFTPVSAALGALSAADGTVAALWRRVGTTGMDICGLTNSARSSWYDCMYIENTGGGKISIDNGGGGSGPTTPIPTAGDWHITAVDWTAAVGGRVHNKDWSTGGAWAHGTTGSLSTSYKSGPGTGGWFNIGYLNDNNCVGHGVAVVAVWAGARIGDTIVEELGANAKTSDWYNCSLGVPTLLVECNVATLVDIGANPSTYSSANSSGATLTGGDPPGWTFDATGAVLVDRFPSADVTAGGWTPSTGTLAGVLGDESDATYATGTLA